MVPYVSKNVLKRKSATLNKYGGKLENGRPKFFHGMCGVFFAGQMVKVRGDSHVWCARTEQETI